MGNPRQNEQGARPAHVTNTSFINAIFQHIPPDAAPLVCTKAGDPTTGVWPAQAAKDSTLADTYNNYVNCSTFRPTPDGSIAARIDHFAAYHFILLDDVGKRVEQGQLQGVTPTWRLETSPGNFQWGLVLADPIRDYEQARRLQKAVARKGLTDPGASGPNRWARLPVGINGKPAYGKDGKPFECRLISFDPELRFTVEQLVELLSLGLNETPTPTAAPGTSTAPATLAELEELLGYLDPSMGRHDWIRVGMALWHETEGSEEGFELFNRWSCKGTNYKSTKDVRDQWDSFHEVPKPVTRATLWTMAMPRLELRAQQFESCEYTVERAPASQAALPHHPLDQYNITADLDELDRLAIHPAPLFGQIFLHGEFGVAYGKPGTGKTLIMLRLVCDAIEERRVDPSKVFYLNMDDSSAGIAEKARIAQEAGFQMLAPGRNQFDKDVFYRVVQEMVDKRSAQDSVLILDTLPQFVNLMNKDNALAFAQLVRSFVMVGGTVIALAHTNKHSGPDGNPVYAGTSDIHNHCDCAWTMQEISNDGDTRVIEFHNFKRRGYVPGDVWYSYANGDVSYAERFASVTELESAAASAARRQQDLISDADIIQAIEDTIPAGICTKMKLAKAVAARVTCSRARAIAVIEKYTGPDGLWQFEIRARGAKVYVLNERQAEPEISRNPGELET